MDAGGIKVGERELGGEGVVEDGAGGDAEEGGLGAAMDAATLISTVAPALVAAGEIAELPY